MKIDPEKAGLVPKKTDEKIITVELTMGEARAIALLGHRFARGLADHELHDGLNKIIMALG